MKVIFYKDVAGVARKFDIKTVSDGYALNFLMPRNLAIRATEEEIGKLEAMKAKENKAKEETQASIIKNLKKISSTNVTIVEQANEKGHLFKGIGKDVLISEIKKQIGIDMNADFIVLDKPIKDLGEHKIEIKAGEKNAFLTVIVSNN
jgi:large subunit ribosomal protein L9